MRELDRNESFLWPWAQVEGVLVPGHWRVTWCHGGGSVNLKRRGNLLFLQVKMWWQYLSVYLFELLIFPCHPCSPEDRQQTGPGTQCPVTTGDQAEKVDTRGHMRGHWAECRVPTRCCPSSGSWDGASCRMSGTSYWSMMKLISSHLFPHMHHGQCWQESKWSV